MAFQYILANLLALTDSAVGALFLDPTGEMIDFAITDFSPYQVRILGAYLGIHLRQLDRMLVANRLGEAQLLEIEQEGLNILAVPLPDGYAMALLQRSSGALAVARKQLLRAAEEMAAEVLPQPRR